MKHMINLKGLSQGQLTGELYSSDIDTWVTAPIMFKAWRYKYIQILTGSAEALTSSNSLVGLGYRVESLVWQPVY